eukprot:2582114-Amphidinium_carterae.1
MATVAESHRQTFHNEKHLPKERQASWQRKIEDEAIINRRYYFRDDCSAEHQSSQRYDSQLQCGCATNSNDDQQIYYNPDRHKTYFICELDYY